MAARVAVLCFAVVVVGASQRAGSSLCSVAHFVLDICMIHAWCDG